MFKFYTRNRCKPPGYAKNLLRAIQIAAFILLANNPQIGHAQRNLIDVKGIVYDDQGKPLVGATIKIKEAERSVKTDAKGAFIIYGVDQKAILQASYIGFQTDELSAMTGFITFRLSQLTSNLDQVEIVNTGYQVLDRNKTTGSFVQVDNKLLNRSVSTNVLDRLKNIAPGIYFEDRDMQLTKTALNPVDKNSGITIRGQSTLNSSKEPLIVVDNFPFEGEIGNINPNDVESISILKDASAASIWGARSGNGVIVITTKKGRLNQKVKVEFNSNVSLIQKPNLKYDPSFLSSRGYIEVEQYLYDHGYFDSQINDVTSFPIVSPAVELMVKLKSATSDAERSDIQTKLEQLKNLDVRDDYAKYVYQTAINQQYSLGLRGGAENITYNLSAGTDNNKNNLDRNGYKRNTLNLGTTYIPAKNIELVAGINYSKSINSLNNNFGYGSVNGIGYPYSTLYPYASFTNADGSSSSILQNLRSSYIDASRTKGFLDWNLRPLDEINLSDHKLNTSDLIVKLGAKYNFSQYLSVEVNYQNERQSIVDRNFRKQDTYFVRNLINQFSTYNSTTGAVGYVFPKGGILDLTNSTWNNNNLRAQINARKSIQKSNISGLIGAELKELSTEQLSRSLFGYNDNFGTSATNLNYGTFYPTNPSGSATLPSSSGAILGYLNRNVSYFAIGNYDYDGKYLANFSVRKEGANLFGAKANDKFSPFFSAGLGWNLNNENFYAISWLPQLRLRTTFGYQGNTYQNGSAYLTGNYAVQSLTGANYLFGTNAPNPRLQWERVKNFNIGVDFSTKNNTISGTIEVYSKSGKDLIQPTVLAGQTGFPTYLANTASTRTRGIDLTLYSQNIHGKFGWTTTLLMSVVHDKVIKYDVPLNEGSLALGSYAVGKPLNALFSYRWEGLNPSNGNPRGLLNGQISENYAGIRSNFNTDSLIYNGSQMPTVFGAIRNDFSFREFSLSVNISYRLGYVFRRRSTSLGYDNIILAGQHEDYEKRWQKPGDELRTNVPSVIYPGDYYRDSFYQLSETLVEKGDHIRLQDIRLSYRVPGLASKNHFISGLTVYSYANNLGIIWRKNKLGLDPAVSSSGLAQYPNPFAISFGLNANF